MLCQGQLRISGPWQQASKALDTKDRPSIGWYLASCSRVVTSPMATAQEESLFMAESSMTRTSTSSILDLVLYPWPIQDLIQMAPSSSSQPPPPHGWTTNTWSSVKSLMVWMWSGAIEQLGSQKWKDIEANCHF